VVRAAGQPFSFGPAACAPDGSSSHDNIMLLLEELAVKEGRQRLQASVSSW
jgi:hypothetical protein